MSSIPPWGALPGRPSVGRALAAGSRRPGVNVHVGTDGRDLLVNTPDGWEVDQPGLWWEGPAGGDGTGGPVGNPPPGAFPPGGLPAVVTRCTTLIADVIAGLPWHVRRDTDRERLPTPDWIADPQALRVDRRITAEPVPDYRKSAVEFWAAGITSMLWLGECMIFVGQRNSDGSPAPPLWMLNPTDVGIEDGRYAVEGYTFAPGELIVIRGLSPYPGALRGVGVLQAHWPDIALAAQVRGFAGNMLRRGIPAGYLKVSSPQLTRDQAREVQSEWMRQHSGVRRKVAVLNASTEFHALGLDPAALQLAQMRDYTTLDVCLAFGIPPSMLGINTDRNTYANLETRLSEYRVQALLTWTRKLESALDAELPRGTSLKIAMDGLVRPETLPRYQAHEIGLRAGFLTLEEVREMEDRPPLPVEAAAEAHLRLLAQGGGEQPSQANLSQQP